MYLITFLEKYRQCTDKLCIYIGISFTIILLILTAALFNNGIYSINKIIILKQAFPQTLMGEFVVWISQIIHMFILQTFHKQYNL